jgi:hypothetical protein
MSETFTPDKLIAGDFPIRTEAATVVSGAGALPRGRVLGKITTGGKLVSVESDGTDDGRRTPYAVLLEAVDATSADKVASVALTGEFNSGALSFGGTDTTTTHKAAMRDLSLFVVVPQAAV